jgi:hypothetical protein
VVHRPRASLNCLWEPLCLTSTKPMASRILTTSAGFRTGSLPKSLTRYTNLLQANEISFELGLAILKQHLNHLMEVGLQFLNGLSLAMGTGESRHITNEQSGAGTALNHSGKRSHGLVSGWFGPILVQILARRSFQRQPPAPMTLNESIVEEAALGWFQELGYALLPGPQLAPGESAAERESFSDVVLVGRLHEAIGRFNPANS